MRDKKALEPSGAPKELPEIKNWESISDQSQTFDPEKIEDNEKINGCIVEIYVYHSYVWFFISKMQFTLICIYNGNNVYMYSLKNVEKI